jgi:hypothetical protein
VPSSLFVSYIGLRHFLNRLVACQVFPDNHSE